MSAYEASNKSFRSHSIHVAAARDYQRIKMGQKQEIKLQQDFIKLHRKMTSNAKWNERFENRNLYRNSIAHLNDSQENPPMTLDEYLVREKLKQKNIDNAKKVANEHIRRH